MIGVRWHSEAPEGGTETDLTRLSTCVVAGSDLLGLRSG